MNVRERVLRNAGARPAQPGEVRRYLLRALDGDPTAPPRIIEVTVPAACPARVGDHRCGIARGAPEERTLRDSQARTEYTITVPERQPCGHVVLHRDLIAEHENLHLRESA